MDTDVRTPPPPLAPASGESRPRSFRLWWVAAVLVVAAGIVVAAWLSNVEPISRGSSGYDLLMGLPPSMSETALVQDVDAFGVEGRVLTVEAVPDASFTYMVSIRNDGPVPITIRGLSPDEGDRIRLVGMVPDIWAQGRVARETVPFQPFELRPDGEAALAFQVRIPGGACMAPGTVTTSVAPPVEFTVFGIEREQLVDTGVEIEVLGTKATAC